MKFYKIPFIWLLLPFILGIVSHELIPINFSHSFYLLIFFSSTLTFIFFNKKVKFNFIVILIFISICFFLAGQTIMSLENNNNIKNAPLENFENCNYIGSIKELSITQSGYIKCIIQSKKEPSNQSKTYKRLLFIKLDNNKTNLTENSTIIFNCKFEKIRNLGYPGEFDSEFYWKNKGINEIAFIPICNIKLIKKGNTSIFTPTYLRNKLLEILKSVLTGQELALANALILGERNLLTNDTTQQFSNTGAMHILAVSGLHIGILLQILLKFLQPFQKLISKNKATILSLFILWIYAITTGFSASVVRSVIMFSLISLGSIRGKKNSELNALAFSALLILSWKPIFIYDVGFQLSYTAMLGIYLFYPFLKTVIVSRNKIIQLITEGTMIGIAAQITTLPLTLYYFHQFPNYFILTNIALMGFSFIILLLGLLLFCFYWIPLIKFMLGFILQKTMSLMLTIVSYLSNLPFATANGFSFSKFMILCLYIIIILLFISIVYKKIKLLYIVLINATIISILIFQNRVENNIQSFKYTHSTFKIIKSCSTNYFLFPSYSRNSNKSKRIIKDFTNLHPGKSVLIPTERLSHY